MKKVYIVRLSDEEREACRAIVKKLKGTSTKVRRANIFMLTDPLGCWRRVSVRERKTKIDWALEVAVLLEEDYPNVDKIWLVCDNLSVYSLGAFYETFEPSRARSLARRLEMIPTPKHGRWLNVAENELSSLTVQCVKDRRFGTIEELRWEVTAWADQCNTKQKGIHWHFTTENARAKLQSLYPKSILTRQ